MLYHSALYYAILIDVICCCVYSFTFVVYTMWVKTMNLLDIALQNMAIENRFMLPSPLCSLYSFVFPIYGKSNFGTFGYRWKYRSFPALHSWGKNIKEIFQKFVKGTVSTYFSPVFHDSNTFGSLIYLLKLFHIQYSMVSISRRYLHAPKTLPCH